LEKIFDEELNSSIAVCVSADFKMTQGIELAIRRKFGNIARLRGLNRSVTEIASLHRKNNSILSYHKITLLAKVYLQKCISKPHKPQEYMHRMRNHSTGMPMFRVRSNSIKMGNFSFHDMLYILELFYYYKGDDKRGADTRRTTANTKKIPH